MDVGILRVLLEGTFELLLGDRIVALLEVRDAELDVGLGGLLSGVFFLARRGAIGGDTASKQARYQSRPNQRGREADPTSVHARTCKPKVLEPSRTMVRSVTWPASCPQAASMSSPRVLRIVTINPRCMSSSRNFSIAACGERR